MIYIPQNILAQEWTFLLAYFSSFIGLIHCFFKISFGFVLALTFQKKNTRLFLLNTLAFQLHVHFTFSDSFSNCDLEHHSRATWM